MESHVFNKEEFMVRTYLSLLALVLVLAAQPAITASQSAGSQPAARPAPTNIVNINTALVPELETLPGVGTKTAERIIEYRQKNGPFKKVEELMNVRGLGEKNFLKLKAQLTVGAPRASNDRSQQ
jgi:competence protein ComEA